MDIQETRKELQRSLYSARAYTDGFFSLIHPDSFYERSISVRHRFIFYLGHLEAFDWNMIFNGALGLNSSQSELNELFAFGIDPSPGQLPQDQLSDWPSVPEVHQYNKEIRRIIDEKINDIPEVHLQVALEHRLMHFETLTYILHQLPNDQKTLTVLPNMVEGPSPKHSMIDIPGGFVTLGKKQGNGFGWDNEFDEHQVPVPPFAIEKYKVTNGQYLEFVKEGAKPPLFWFDREGKWFCRTVFGEVPLPLDWPVYVAHQEATAYAQWAGKSLPTEAQYHRAAFGTTDGQERVYPWGNKPPSDMGIGNIDFRRWDPVPVSATPELDSAFNVSQLLGNGWEWTSTVFRPYEGFNPFAFYPHYSSRFFDDVHYVMKGASWQTESRLMRRSFRNWFRETYPYVYAGFRCVDH